MPYPCRTSISVALAVGLTAACGVSHEPTDGVEDASPAMDAGRGLRDAATEPDASPDGGFDAGERPPDAAVADGGADAGDAAIPLDAGPSCAEGETECDGECVDLASDALHCGACGTSCHAIDGMCLASACAPTGERCDARLVLTDGRNVLPWRASTLDHDWSDCLPLGDPSDHDVVAEYVFPRTGYVRISVPEAPAGHAAMAITDGCGAAATELTCDLPEDHDPPGRPLEAFVHNTAGESSHVHLRGPPSSPNPLVVDVDPIDCATDVARGTPVEPAAGTVTDSLWVSRVVVRFDRPLRWLGPGSPASSATLTGDMGTTAVFPYAYAVSSRTLELEDWLLSAVRFRAGETVTVTVELPGYVDSLCGNPVPPVTWTFTVVAAPCEPGVGGVFAGTPTGRGFPYTGARMAMAADPDPGGWIYATEVFEHAPVRVDKELVDYHPFTGEPGWPVFHGRELYLLDPLGVSRLSRDGGATLSPERYASVPFVGRVGFPVAYRGEIFVTTTDATGTTVWRVPAGATTPPVTAVLDRHVPGETRCMGLAVDDGAYFLSCEPPAWGPQRLVRVDRGTGAVTLVTDRFRHNGTASIAHDIDGDGSADVLYGGDDDGAFMVCDPHAAAPYTDYVVRDHGSTATGAVWDPAGPRAVVARSAFTIVLQ